MSEIQFLASSKSLNQDEIDFYITDLDDYWINIVKPIFTMPYLYEVRGLGKPEFWTYIEKDMEVGDVLELYTIPVQQWYQTYIRDMLEKPNHITINIGSRTYQNFLGAFQLPEKRWLDELRHRTLVTEFGVTTILNY